jgi:hypothetical protein
MRYNSLVRLRKAAKYFFYNGNFAYTSSEPVSSTHARLGPVIKLFDKNWSLLYVATSNKTDG